MSWSTPSPPSTWTSMSGDRFPRSTGGRFFSCGDGLELGTSADLGRLGGRHIDHLARLGVAGRARRTGPLLDGQPAGDAELLPAPRDHAGDHVEEPLQAGVNVATGDASPLG